MEVIIVALGIFCAVFLGIVALYIYREYIGDYHNARDRDHM